MAIYKNASSIMVDLQRQLLQKSVCGDQLFVELDQSGIVQRIEGTVHTGLEEKRLGRGCERVVLTYDDSVKKSKSVNIESCYLPTRVGIPLVHVITYEKEGQLVSVMIHSLTGKVISE